ncbi:MAG: hypothetical protein ISS82_03335 [Nanoarchaeota archaeon]|nr:hypothetical protein [Nanoarchaeota archaeon]
MVKSIFKSKTFWVNIIVAVILGIFGVEIGVDPQMELLVLGLVNICLRFATKESVKI